MDRWTETQTIFSKSLSAATDTNTDSQTQTTTLSKSLSAATDTLLWRIGVSCHQLTRLVISGTEVARSIYFYQTEQTDIQNYMASPAIRWRDQRYKILVGKMKTTGY